MSAAEAEIAEAMKSPGAVFRNARRTRLRRLAHDVTLGDGQTATATSLGEGKFHAFYQLCLKPPLAVFAGEIIGPSEAGQAGPAGRLMAVETAVKQ